MLSKEGFSIDPKSVFDLSYQEVLLPPCLRGSYEIIYLLAQLGNLELHGQDHHQKKQNNYHKKHVHDQTSSSVYNARVHAVCEAESVACHLNMTSNMTHPLQSSVRVRSSASDSYNIFTEEKTKIFVGLLVRIHEYALPLLQGGGPDLRRHFVRRERAGQRLGDQHKKVQDISKIQLTPVHFRKME